MNRSDKAELIETLHTTFSDAASVVIAHQTGLTVVESSDLRNRMREGGATFKVTKNRIAKIALKDTPYEKLEEHFSGPTAIGASSDLVTAAKVLVAFAKENDKLEIIGGAIGEQVLDKAEVERLAKLPSLDELRSKLLGILQASASKLVGVIEAPASQLARVIAAKPGVAEPEAEVPEEAKAEEAKPEEAAAEEAKPEEAADEEAKPEEAEAEAEAKPEEAEAEAQPEEAKAEEAEAEAKPEEAEAEEPKPEEAKADEAEEAKPEEGEAEAEESKQD